MAEQPEGGGLPGNISSVVAAGKGIPGGIQEPHALRHNQQVEPPFLLKVGVQQSQLPEPSYQ